MTATADSDEVVDVEMVTLTIDDVELSVPKGTLVIRAAELIGIEIPAVLRPSAAGSGRRMPAVPRGGRRPAQAHGVVHDCGHRRDGGAYPVHLGSCRQGSARRDGAAADQPSAGLPGVRQGRRMPAAEPGNVQRARGFSLRGRQTHVPQADQHQLAGAAGPRTVRSVCALHPVLRPDRRGPVHRAARTRRAAAGRYLHQRTVRLLLFGQHRADLPGRGTDRSRVPVPGPPVRSGVEPERVRTLRVGLRAAYRSPPRRGVAPAGRRRPTSQRGVELRQGPLGVHLRHPTRPDHHPVDPRRGRHAGGRLVVGGADRRGQGTVGGLRQRRRSRRRTRDAGGRLRLRQVRACGVGQQRHRLPRSVPLRGGVGVLGGTHRRSADNGHLRGSGSRAGGAAGRVRARRGIADRVPAAAQGRAQAPHADLLGRAVRHPWARQDVRHAVAVRSRRRGVAARRVAKRRVRRNPQCLRRGDHAR